MRADLHLQIFQFGTLPLQFFFVGADLQILDFLRHVVERVDQRAKLRRVPLLLRDLVVDVAALNLLCRFGQPGNGARNLPL
ncbi:hypothetical protein SDC9_181934 [bioreactor metagenome]|uniref:Uncharacterized protein n=1 Tax=bioreactor metagenome TaxID=1076179 RepID=A0A645H5Z1_9ZZZZ